MTIWLHVYEKYLVRIFRWKSLYENGAQCGIAAEITKKSFEKGFAMGGPLSVDSKLIWKSYE